MNRIYSVSILIFSLLVAGLASAQTPNDKQLRIIAFGAHPDDCELKAGGVAALWSAQGHHVKFVSVTNGDIGHWREAGGPLARRRTAEVEQAARLLGITTEVLDIHDGELMPTLENRRTITRLIREWGADIVMSHRPNDYHPDHRYTGVLGAGPPLPPGRAALPPHPGLPLLRERFGGAKPSPPRRGRGHRRGH